MAPAHPQRATSAAAVDSEQFAAQAETNVAPDEVFFYRYFKDKAKEKPSKMKKKKKV